MSFQNVPTYWGTGGVEVASAQSVSELTEKYDALKKENNEVKAEIEELTKFIKKSESALAIQEREFRENEAARDQMIESRVTRLENTEHMHEEKEAHLPSVTEMNQNLIALQQKESRLQELLTSLTATIEEVKARQINVSAPVPVVQSNPLCSVM